MANAKAEILCDGETSVIEANGLGKVYNVSHLWRARPFMAPLFLAAALVMSAHGPAPAASSTEVPDFEINRGLLKEAIESWRDWENRRREETIALFEEYLQTVPDSPYRAEIYVRIGLLYGQKANTSLGEKREYEESVKWFERAIDLYGDKYCHYARIARSESAYDTRNMSRMRSYYEWLRFLAEEATVDDVWPYRGMGMAWWETKPLLDPDERSQRLAYGQKRIPQEIDGIIEMLTNYGSTADLTDLVASYPSTSLAECAAEEMKIRLDRESQRTVEEMRLERLDAPPSGEAGDDWRFSLESVMEARKDAPYDGHSLPLDVESDTDAPPPGDAGESGGRSFPWRPLLAAAVLVIALALIFVASRRRSSLR